MSTQQALALPSPPPSNTVVINPRCSLRIEEDQRVIVVAGLPMHRYRVEDALAEAYGQQDLRMDNTALGQVVVANRNYRRLGSQSSGGRAHDDCNGLEGSDPQSSQLGP